jgi:hypothetical protein
MDHLAAGAAAPAAVLAGLEAEVRANVPGGAMPQLRPAEQEGPFSLRLPRQIRNLTTLAAGEDKRYHRDRVPWAAGAAALVGSLEPLEQAALDLATHRQAVLVAARLIQPPPVRMELQERAGLLRIPLREATEEALAAVLAEALRKTWIGAAKAAGAAAATTPEPAARVALEDSPAAVEEAAVVARTKAATVALAATASCADGIGHDALLRW